jgi:hypothetical protein
MWAKSYPAMRLVQYVIDQTSFRTKGTVIIFGLAILQTKECTVHLHTVSHSLIRYTESGMKEGWRHIIPLNSFIFMLSPS